MQNQQLIGIGIFNTSDPCLFFSSFEQFHFTIKVSLSSLLVLAVKDFEIQDQVVFFVNVKAVIEYGPGRSIYIRGNSFSLNRPKQLNLHSLC